MPAGHTMIATGIDFSNALAVADALGYSVPDVADCLSAAEAGLVIGANKRGSDADG